MHYTLHLTNDCNLSCKYCYVNKEKKRMSPETLRKAIDFALENSSGPTGLVFYGGEPLLCKDLICLAVEYCRQIGKKGKCVFHFKMTTNGTLLDEDFIAFAKKENIFIALSHDGIREAHDANRTFTGGRGTFDTLSEKVGLLLSSKPYAPAMLVVDPDNVRYFYESVSYLFDRGFRYVLCSMNYTGSWNRDTLDILKVQYKKLSTLYFEKTMREDKFYFSPFDTKICNRVSGGEGQGKRCQLGREQVSITWDGVIYPCVQFAEHPEYAIGHIDTGFDESKRMSLDTENSTEQEPCSQCAIKKRCNRFCGCINILATGAVDKISPILCRHERILIPIADKLAERLYKKRSPMFIQKHYNDMYPLVSLVEDGQYGL